MKKLLSIILSVLMIFSVSIPGYASGNYISYGEFMEYVEAGYISEDITYAQWCRIIDENRSLAYALENSSDFELVYSSETPGLYSSYSMQTGDIYVTTATSFAGLTGHAGISINSSSILHIEGIGYTPATISYSAWLDKYDDAGGWTRVYRHTNSSVALSAGIWALVNYNGSNASYSINPDLYGTNKTYCSKIVWQAYYYTEPVGTHVSLPTGTANIVHPYSLESLIHNVSMIHYVTNS